ncbi:MAG: 2-phospho-L-lactate transferase [Chloroflexi bacterium]|nr:2-phospho-L-lactate transferase [Chloroflexota bacterium]
MNSRDPAVDGVQHVVVLAGGYGGAKLSHGMTLVATARRAEGGRPLDLSVIVNTGDDLELHGLLVSPDLDTVLYTLAGWANSETGWGVRDETWSNADMLGRYGAPTWFSLGDRDLATHVLRTERIRAGATLTSVTAELARALGVRARILPMTDAPVRTRLRTDAGWLDFQDYFVRRHHADPVHELRFDGLTDARPTPEVSAALRSAHVLVLAPSNPFVSIGPILGLAGVVDVLHEARARGVPVVAISPIVGGVALRGPADRMFRSLGGEPSAAGVARHYAERYPGLIETLVIDEQDLGDGEAIAATGIRSVVGPAVMRDDADRRRLAEFVLDIAEQDSTRA